MKPADTYASASRWAGNFTLGLMVVALYWLFVIAVFAGFASYMTRSDWSSDAAFTGDDRHDLDTLFHLMNREAVLRRNIETAREEVAKIDVEIDTALAELEAMRRDRLSADSALRRAAAMTLMELRSLADDVHETAVPKLIALIEDSDLAIDEKAKEALVLAPQLPFRPGLDDARLDQMATVLSQAAARMEAADGRLADLLARVQSAERTRDRHLTARQWPSRQLEAYQAELRTLSDLLPMNSNQRARMGALSGIFWGIPHYLVGFPTIFLTLIVTIAAGGLGAVVSFSRAMFKTDVPTSRARLFVSVGEGIAAAIAIFLFSGAGFLALAPGSGSVASLEISPYTVAFAAFLSGFMAEDAFARIQLAGRRLFASEDEDAVGDRSNGVRDQPS